MQPGARSPIYKKIAEIIMIKINKKLLVSTVLFFVVLLFATATIIKEKEKNAPSLDVIVTDSPIVFYFGVSCPHCKLVEQYLTENKVAEKVRFSMKEVYENKNNANEAFAKAELCGISKNKLGVPFLWDGEKCYMGDENIINFFKEKLNEK